MTYIRLPGKKRGFIRYWTLWLGTDHLLAVESSMGQERYKRFYFKDIQALIAARARHSKTRSIVSAALFILFALPLILRPLSFSTLAIVLSTLAAAIALIFFLIDLIKGLSCVCLIQTPVAVHALPSLNRMKYIEKVLPVVRSKVEAFQGTFSWEELKRLSAAAAAAAEERADRGDLFLKAGESLVPPFKKPLYGGGLHWALFSLLLLEAALTLIRYDYNNLALTILSMIVVFGIFFAGIAALIRQKGRNVPLLAKFLSWTALALVIADSLVAYFYSIFLIVLSRQQDKVDAQRAMISLLAKVRRSGDWFLGKADLFYACAILICGAAGLLAMNLRRRRNGRAAAAAPGSGAFRQEGER